MVIRLILISLFIVGCGREVKLKANKLESTQQITEADKQKYQMSGTLTKSAASTILFQGRSYKVSIYSSKVSQDFINIIPNGSQVPVIFTGGFSGNDVVLESIKRQ